MDRRDIFTKRITRMQWSYGGMLAVPSAIGPVIADIVLHHRGQPPPGCRLDVPRGLFELARTMLAVALIKLRALTESG
jgi:hypothetical protein